MPDPTSALALERFTSFGDLLKFLRRRVGLTQRELSIAVGYSHAQISRLELNQRLPDLATLTARFIPSLDLDDQPAIAARLLELAAAIPREAAPAAGLAPFKGLHYFDEADSELFFGREVLTLRLLERIETALSASPTLRFLSIVGASGSGKSSIVRAGLIPAIRRSQSLAQWQIRCFTPTARPLQALAASLYQGTKSVTHTATLIDDLSRDSRALHLTADRLASARKPTATRRTQAAPHLLLVIDQFEELFTLCQSEDERLAYIKDLVTAATEPGGLTFIVITLRADFYNHCGSYSDLREMLAHQQDYIGPMNADDLRRAIEGPAKRGNWYLEPGLIEVLLQDVGADGDRPPEPGALPLLSHALLETWQRRRGRTLTLSGYLASGGVRGAIAETADIVFHDQLDPTEQAIARQIFLRLTQLGDDDATAETRRRATFEELILRPETAPVVRDVLTTLADARLIITDNGVVEVAHEALIREWPTLQGWLEEDREGLRLHRHLTLAANSWERRGRDPSELYRGGRLAQTLAWAGTHIDALNDSEQAFLNLSKAQAEQESMAQEAQRQRELKAAQSLAESQRRAAVQLRNRAYYLLGAFILALIMAGVALFQGEQARQSAIAAQDAQRITYARELAGAAINDLEVDPERSILLALQAVSTTRTVDGTVLPEAQEALHRSLLASQVRLTLTGHNTGVLTAAFSPDGQRVATIGQDGVTIIWDATTGEELRRLPGATAIGDEISAQRLTFSPDVRWLATADNSLIRIWDANTGEPSQTLSDHSGEVWAIAFSPDGTQLASGGADAEVYLWDVASGAAQFELRGHTEAIEELAFSPDGRWLVTASDDLSLKVWDTATGGLLQDVSDLTVPAYSVAFSPDGRRMATDNFIWDTSTLPFQRAFTIPENISAVMFSPDGNWLAGSSGSTAKVWDAATGQGLLTLAGHTTWVTDVAFSPDGKRLATTSLDETAKVWSLTPGYEVATLVSKGWRVAFSPDGEHLATEGLDGSASVWDAATGELVRELAGHTQSLLNVAYHPDGVRLATASFDATAKIWDTGTGAELLTLSGHESGIRDAAFSPDGSRIITGSFDTTAKVWDAVTGEVLLTLNGHEGGVVGVAYSPDGKWIATSSLDAIAKLWDAETGELLFTLIGHDKPIPDIAFSPDGRLVATGSQDTTAKLWDATTGAEVFILSGSSAEIQSVAFSPGGKWLATGSGDNTARVWEVATGRSLITLPGSVGGVTGVAFNPGPGRPELAVASGDGVVRVFLLQIEDAVALAQSRLTRSLTLTECRKYLHLQECPVNAP